MPLKCVHKGCGKEFEDPDEPCHYHPGPPEFHEGHKGWLHMRQLRFRFILLFILQANMSGSIMRSSLSDSADNFTFFQAGSVANRVL